MLNQSTESMKNQLASYDSYQDIVKNGTFIVLLALIEVCSAATSGRGYIVANVATAQRKVHECRQSQYEENIAIRRG